VRNFDERAVSDLRFGIVVTRHHQPVETVLQAVRYTFQRTTSTEAGVKNFLWTGASYVLLVLFRHAFNAVDDLPIWSFPRLGSELIGVVCATSALEIYAHKVKR
jgi:hypothetical protein